VRAVLTEIEASNVPELVVINKCDAADPFVIDRLKLHEKNVVAVSALTGQGIDELVALIEKQLPMLQFHIEVLIPYEKGNLVARIYLEGMVQSRTDTEQGTVVVAKVGAALNNELNRLLGASSM
jgi:GTP-binding protein HflX